MRMGGHADPGRGCGAYPPHPLSLQTKVETLRGKRIWVRHMVFEQGQVPKISFSWARLGSECRAGIWPSVYQKPWLYLLYWDQRTGRKVFWSTTVNTFFFFYFDKWFMLPKSNCLKCFFFLFNFFLVHIVSCIIFYSFFLHLFFLFESYAYIHLFRAIAIMIVGVLLVYLSSVPVYIACAWYLVTWMNDDRIGGVVCREKSGSNS